MKFINDKHKTQYEQILSGVQKQKRDCYHKAFFFLMAAIGYNQQTITELYNFEEGCIMPEKFPCYASSGELAIYRLAINLYTDRNGGDALGGYEKYTPVELFSRVSNEWFLAMIEAINIRFERVK